MNNTTQQDMVDLLCEKVILAMRIPVGTNLVWILGQGNESTNHEALRSWMHSVLLQPDHDIACYLLPVMIQRLQQQLLEGDVGC